MVILSARRKIISSTLSRVIYSLTGQLSTNNTTSPTNIYSSQCIPPVTHSLAPHHPNKQYLLSILPFLPHLHYENMTSTTFTIISKPWLTNITMIWKPWMTTYLICLQNLPIQVPRHIIMKNNSHIFHPNSQANKTTSINWASNKHRSSPCHSLSYKFSPNYQLMETALTEWASPTSTNLK